MLLLLTGVTFDPLNVADSSRIASAALSISDINLPLKAQPTARLFIDIALESGTKEPTLQNIHELL